MIFLVITGILLVVPIIVVITDSFDVRSEIFNDRLGKPLKKVLTFFKA